MSQQKGEYSKLGIKVAPINSSEDGDNRAFALHSAAARISSLTLHSPILQLRKLRFMEMNLLSKVTQLW